MNSTLASNHLGDVEPVPPKGNGGARQTAPARHARQSREMPFSPGLEARFRDLAINLNIQRARVIHAGGILAVLGFLFANSLQGRTLASSSVGMLVLYLLVPLLLVGMFLPQLRGNWRTRQAAVFANTVLLSGVLVAVVALSSASQAVLPYEPLILAIVYAYFLSGLSLLPASLIGFGVLAAYTLVLADWSVGEQVGHQLAYLLMFNAMGLASLFMFDRQQRRDFLMERRLRAEVPVDPLTQVLNRGAFLLHLDRAWDMAARDSKRMGLLMVDVDWFERVNAHCGRAQGDDLLRHIGVSLRDAARRPMDAGARYGGDSFVLLLYDVSFTHFDAVARILQAGAQGIHHHGDQPHTRVTLSAGGVLVQPRQHSSPQEALRAAADRLRQVKDCGRNGVQIISMI